LKLFNLQAFLLSFDLLDRTQELTGVNKFMIQKPSGRQMKGEKNSIFKQLSRYD
jgi:hypothetical protein